MEAGHSSFRHVLESRYTGQDIKVLFSDDHRFFLWRRFWERSLFHLNRMGAIELLPAVFSEMEENLSNIDYDKAAALEAKLFHDVEAHAETFGLTVPSAAAFIHCGNTSCDVTDNMDQVIICEAIDLTTLKLARVIQRMSVQARQWIELPVLGRTHLQPAQPTTVGKRIGMWMQDLVLSLTDLERFRQDMPWRGVTGVVGTQASFLEILGSQEKVDKFNAAMAEEFGFAQRLPLTGQTYTRWLDSTLASKLAVLAASLHKIATDVRLMQTFREVREPSSKAQTGSTAQPYKRNPMKNERTCGIARRAVSAVSEALMTQATQWLERSLDDSSARRIFIPDAFLAIDAALKLAQATFEGLEVFPAMIRRNLDEYAPFLTSEVIIAAAVKAGMSRPRVHARLNVHARAADEEMMRYGRDNNYLDLIIIDPFFDPIVACLADPSLTDPSRFIGLAVRQTDDFLRDIVEPILERYGERLEGEVKLTV